MANTQGIKAGRAYVELGVGDKLTAGLKRAQARLKAFGASVTNIGRKMLAGGLAASAPMIASAKVFGGFEDQMLTVRAVTAATQKQFKALADQAKLLGRTTSFTARQVAEGMTSLGRAGFRPSEIQAAVPAVLNLARATGTDLGRAADYAANAVRAFGLSARDTATVADVLTATANGSAQTLDDLAEALKYVAPVAADAGESIQSTSKALGVLANMGIKGSMAGTTMRKILLSLANPSVRRTLAGIGIAATDATGNLRPLGDIMLELGKAMGRLPNAQRLTLANDLFGQRAVSGALKLTGSVAMLDDLARAIAASGDAAERTAKMMDSGLGGSFRIMMSAVEGVALAIGEALGNSLKKAVSTIQHLAEGAAKWVEANQGLVTTIGLVAAGAVAAGAGLLVFGKLIGAAGAAVGVLTTGVKLLGAALAGVVSPIGLVMAAVGALGAYLLTATKAGAKALDWLSGKFATLKADALAAYEGMGDALAAGDIALAAKILWLTLKLQWKRGVHTLLDVWLGFKHDFLKLVYGTWYGALALGEAVWHGLEVGWIETTGFLAKTWSGFVGFFQRTWHQMSAVAQKAWVWIKSLFDDSIDVEAQYGRIDEARNEAFRKIADDRNRAIRDRERKRQKEREAEERRHQGRLLAIGQAHQARRDAMADEQRDRMKAATDELAAAQEQWKQALAAASKKRRDREVDQDAGPGKLEGPEEVMSRIRAAAGSLDRQLATSVRGTFNAAAGLFGFGAGSAMERTAAAAEQTAKNTRDMKRLLQDGGAEFE